MTTNPRKPGALESKEYRCINTFELAKAVASDITLDILAAIKTGLAEGEDPPYTFGQIHAKVMEIFARSGEYTPHITAPRARVKGYLRVRYWDNGSLVVEHPAEIPEYLWPDDHSPPNPGGLLRVIEDQQRTSITLCEFQFLAEGDNVTTEAPSSDHTFFVCRTVGVEPDTSDHPDRIREELGIPVLRPAKEDGRIVDRPVKRKEKKGP